MATILETGTAGSAPLRQTTPASDDFARAGLSFLASGAASARERRIALFVVIASVAVFLLAAPFAKVKLTPVPAFMPGYIGCVVIISVVTSVILLGQFFRLRSLALLVLCAGYCFDAAIAFVYMLSFPGGLAPHGVIGGGMQTTAWLYALWHSGMPLFVIAYTLLDRRATRPVDDPAGMTIAAGAFVAVVVLAFGVVTTVGHDLLPPIMAGGMTAPSGVYVLSAAWLFSLLALFALWRKPIRTSLDVWVSVTMVAWTCDIALSSVFNAGRYDLGYYSGRGYGLIAVSLVLAAMLLETTGLHGRAIATAVKLSDEVEQTSARAQSAEAKLRQAQKMEAIGNLTGGMAHDFNNLLAIIIGNLDILVARRKADTEIQELGGEALDAALRGADLTRRLLAFARRQPLQPKSVDLNALISDIAHLLGRTLGEHVDIALDLDEGLWPAVIDPAQLDAALTNLATNARDAMANGGTLMITTGNRRLDADYAAQHVEVTPGDYAMIEVSDTGSGMPPEVAARIFEPFFTTKDEGKGTGLGLSMVYGFIKQSGGHINVYSEPGIGTTFRLYLRRDNAGKATESEPAAMTIASGRGETILAVEDNLALRRVVTRQLRELGYKVFEAENGAAALAIMAREKVDLLFTDVVMSGGMSGVDLAKKAVERQPELKVLVTSGFPDAKLNGSMGAPMRWRLLNKPYRKDELARLLREALATQ